MEKVNTEEKVAYHNREKMIDAQGPVKFMFRELRNTTANFNSNRKLGRETTAYQKRMGMELAVKQVSMSSNSRRGEQEFHRRGEHDQQTLAPQPRDAHRLVPREGELLLVYEYFPMGSLDELLYTDARAGVLPPEVTHIKLDEQH
jgi:hypothetical protein